MPTCTSLDRKRHARRGGGPHEGDFVGGKAVGGVHQIAQAAFEGLGFEGEKPGEGADVLIAQVFQLGGR